MKELHTMEEYIKTSQEFISWHHAQTEIEETEQKIYNHSKINKQKVYNNPKNRKAKTKIEKQIPAN